MGQNKNRAKRTLTLDGLFALRELPGMEKLRAYLCTARVTQRSFADVIGLSRSHLNEIISGRKRPSLDVAFAIARATSGAVPVEAWEPSVDGGCHRDEPTTPNQEISHDLSQSDASSDAA